MKKKLLTKTRTFMAMLLVCSSCVITGQSRPVIKVTANDKRSISFDNKKYSSSIYKKAIDAAFIIMSAVFNSPDFQTTMEKIAFPCQNRAIITCGKDGSPVLGKEVLDSLFSKLNVSMIIDLKKGCHKKLGSTLYNTYYTTACLQNIKEDMPDLPLSYAIAVNLCHEYMHQIGFYHSDYKLSGSETPNPDGYNNDIAYRVGWDAYYLVKKWHDGKVKIPGMGDEKGLKSKKKR